ncbi:uncharacterized protein LOC135386258 [Ornithodoros turicata]|uniref:uncharacterized protein LOC135384625 n=1 Tax=Ornithodoros turicata TaxID=34597 RepID=UPI00313907AA
MNFLETPAETWFPKFLIIHADNDTGTLGKLSPFVTAKVIEQAIGKSYQARKLRTGDIQIEVQTKQQSTALESLKQIGDIPVTVTPHRTLNTVKGVISQDELLDCSESEIEDGLTEEGVVSAKRITMRREGREIPTKHVILSFKRHTLPSTIKAGYLNCHVRPFIPNPKRCFKCQRFGHSSQTCRGQTTCPKCSGKDHMSETCQNDFKCVNCQGGHPVYSRSCPRWQDEKQLLKIRTEQNISYKAAKAQLEFQKKGSFSEVVRRGVAPLRVSVETQTVGPPLHTPQQKEKDMEMSPPPVSPSSQVAGSTNEVATASVEAAGNLSIWEGSTQCSPLNTSHSMDVDDDDCSSQKSSSSLPSFSQAMEKREKEKGRGRGIKPKDQQRVPAPRVQPP